MAVIPLNNNGVIVTEADRTPIRASLDTRTGDVTITADNLMARSDRKLTSAQTILAALKEAGIEPSSIVPDPMSPAIPQDSVGVITGGEGTITLAAKDALAAGVALGFEPGILQTMKPVISELVPDSAMTAWQHEVVEKANLAYVPVR